MSHADMSQMSCYLTELSQVVYASCLLFIFGLVAEQGEHASSVHIRMC